MSLEHYRAIVRAKRKTLKPSGFDAGELHPSLFEHQRQIVRWSCRMGKCAAFVDTGLGKTRIQLEWARLVAEYTSGRVLILAPLAVVAQTLREAATMGIEAGHVGGPESIHVTNYERLQHCVASDYVGVVPRRMHEARYDVGVLCPRRQRGPDGRLEAQGSRG